MRNSPKELFGGVDATSAVMLLPAGRKSSEESIASNLKLYSKDSVEESATENSEFPKVCWLGEYGKRFRRGKVRRI